MVPMVRYRGLLSSEDVTEPQIGTLHDGNEYLTFVPTATVELLNSFFQGFLGFKAQDLPKPNYYCPSTNCTWPSFTSLAVCHTCTDVSAHIQKSYGSVSIFNSTWSTVATVPGVTYSLKNGTDGVLRLLSGPIVTQNPLGLIQSSDARYNTSKIRHNLGKVYVTPDPTETLTFSDSQTLLASVLIFSSNSSYENNITAWEETPVNAMECGLSLCVNAYQTAIVNSSFTENIIASASTRVPASYQPVPSQPFGARITNLTSPNLGNSSWTPAHLYAYVKREDFSLEPPASFQGTFNITQGTLESWFSILETELGYNGGDFSSIDYIDNVITGWAFPRMLYTASTSSMASPEPLLEYAAASLTAMIRNGGSNASNSEGVQGELLAWTVRIQVRWAVITGPLGMIVFTIVFLAACIWRSKTMGVAPWKTSALPALVWGLEDHTRDKVRERSSEIWMERRRKAGEEDALEKVCKEIKVMLERRSGIGAQLEG